MLRSTLAPFLRAAQPHLHAARRWWVRVKHWYSLYTLRHAERTWNPTAMELSEVTRRRLLQEICPKCNGTMVRSFYPATDMCLLVPCTYCTPHAPTERPQPVAEPARSFWPITPEGWGSLAGALLALVALAHAAHRLLPFFLC